MKQPEITLLRHQARGWRLQVTSKLLKRLGLKRTAVILDRDDLSQALCMKSWDRVFISEKFVVNRDAKRDLIATGEGFENIVLVEGRGRGSIESFMKAYPYMADFVCHDGYLTGTLKPMEKLCDAMRAMCMLRNNKPFVISVTLLPESRTAGKRMWTVGDPPGCMTRGFLHVCRRYGLIVENLEFLPQDYESGYPFWKNGQRRTREEIVLSVTLQPKLLTEPVED